MSLKTEIIGSCTKCNEAGFLKDAQGFESIPCDCLIRYRATNRLVNSGFSKKSLEYIRGDYSIPEIIAGDNFLQYFLNDPSLTEQKGLGLYIFSPEKGRGKTTLTHHILYQAAKYFSDKSVYMTQRTYAFQNADSFLDSFKNNSAEVPLWKATWFVLDDIGSEDTQQKWRQDLMVSSLQRVLHYRRDHRLPTIFTSNYRPNDLLGLYGDAVRSLLEIKPDGELGGAFYRQVEVGGGVDFRMQDYQDNWGGS